MLLQLYCTSKSITHRLEMWYCDYSFRKRFSRSLIYFGFNSWIISLIYFHEVLNNKFNLGDFVKRFLKFACTLLDALPGISVFQNCISWLLMQNPQRFLWHQSIHFRSLRATRALYSSPFCGRRTSEELQWAFSNTAVVMTSRSSYKAVKHGLIVNHSDSVHVFALDNGEWDRNVGQTKDLPGSTSRLCQRPMLDAQRKTEKTGHVKIYPRNTGPYDTEIPLWDQRALQQA